MKFRNEGDRTLFAVSATVVFSFTALAMASPLIPLLLLHLEASPSLLGTVIGVGSIGSLLLAIPGGRLVRLWGYRTLMLRSALLCVASALFLAFFPSIAGLAAGLFFLEIGRQMYVLAVQAQTADLGPDRDPNVDFSRMNLAFGVGQLVGPAAGGLIIDAAGFFPAWIAIAVLIALTAIAIPRVLPDRRPVRASGGDPQPAAKDWRYFLGAATIIANLASFAVIFVDQARSTFFPVFMQGNGYSATTIGAFMSLRALVSMSAVLYVAPFVKAVGGRVPALIASLLVMAAGIALTPFCGNYPLLTLNALLVGFGFGVAMPLSLATVSEGVAPEDRGTAMSIRLVGKQVALVANPFFFGGLTQRFGLATAFLGGGGVLLLCAIPIALWRRSAKKAENDGLL